MAEHLVQCFDVKLVDPEAGDLTQIREIERTAMERLLGPERAALEQLGRFDGQSAASGIHNEAIRAMSGGRADSFIDYEQGNSGYDWRDRTRSPYGDVRQSQMRRAPKHFKWDSVAGLMNQRNEAGSPPKPKTPTGPSEALGPKLTRDEMVEILLEQQGGLCAGCDRAYDDPRIWHLDHKLPRSEGGIDHISNRALLCPPCNQAKSNRLTISGLRTLNKKNGWMAG